MHTGGFFRFTIPREPFAGRQTYVKLYENSTTSNGTIIQPGSTCLLNENVYHTFSLIPALLIITILSFLNKRVKIKTRTCDGRPGLLLPMNFLGDNTSNRLSIAMAFGVLASSCFYIFNDAASLEETINVKQLYVTDNPWAKALRKVATVLLYGIINYPVLACLTTENQFIGSILGLLYMLQKFIVKMILVFSCDSSFGSLAKEMHLSRAYELSPLFLELPPLVCQVALLIRFTMILRHEILTQRVKRYGELSHQSREDPVLKEIAKKHDFAHVNLLFKNKVNEKPDTREKVWYIQLRDAIYITRPDFKYSTELICTLVVGAFIIYHIAMYLILGFAQVTAELSILRRELKHTPLPNTTFYDFYVNLKLHVFLYLFEMITNSLYVSMAITCTLMILLMLHFLKCHRSQVLNIYRTKIHPNSPSRLVSRSLSFPGYQVAYIGWGFIIMLGILFIVSLIVHAIIKFMKWNAFVKIFLYIFPTYLLVPLVAWLFQYILGWLVFRDRQFPDRTVTIDNHRLYSIMSYFFFFFNILVGFYSAMFRCLKSMALGIFFLSRLDRTPLMTGFHKWDRGYLSYIGFLNKLKSSSHPVMLVFCHVLVNSQTDKMLPLDAEPFVGYRQSDQLTAETSRSAPGKRWSVSSSQTAVNRWLVAYTLLHNPGLKSLRKHNA